MVTQCDGIQFSVHFEGAATAAIHIHNLLRVSGSDLKTGIVHLVLLQERGEGREGEERGGERDE